MSDSHHFFFPLTLQRKKLEEKKGSFFSLCKTLIFFFLSPKLKVHGPPVGIIFLLKRVKDMIWMYASYF